MTIVTRLMRVVLSSKQIRHVFVVMTHSASRITTIILSLYLYLVSMICLQLTVVINVLFYVFWFYVIIIFVIYAVFGGVLLFCCTNVFNYARH